METRWGSLCLGLVVPRALTRRFLPKRRRLVFGRSETLHNTTSQYIISCSPFFRRRLQNQAPPHSSFHRKRLRVGVDSLQGACCLSKQQPASSVCVCVCALTYEQHAVLENPEFDVSCVAEEEFERIGRLHTWSAELVRSSTRPQPFANITQRRIPPTLRRNCRNRSCKKKAEESKANVPPLNDTDWSLASQIDGKQSFYAAVLSNLCYCASHDDYTK